MNAPIPRKPLELSETYLHYNNLIWQVPSWGLAIAAGVVVAAHQISNDQNVSWTVPVSWVRALVLFFGAFLLAALTVALYRYRGYQAASAPDPVPKPPFGEPPAANRYLQGALCLTTGIILGLGLAEGLAWWWLVLLGFLLGFFAWLLAERGHSKLVEKMNGAANKAMQPTGSACG